MEDRTDPVLLTRDGGAAGTVCHTDPLTASILLSKATIKTVKPPTGALFHHFKQFKSFDKNTIF